MDDSGEHCTHSSSYRALRHAKPEHQKPSMSESLILFLRTLAMLSLHPALFSIRECRALRVSYEVSGCSQSARAKYS